MADANVYLHDVRKMVTAVPRSVQVLARSKDSRYVSYTRLDRKQIQFELDKEYKTFYPCQELNFRCPTRLT
jgi:hypothetical protein